MYLFDDEITKLCLTSDECMLKKAFVLESFIDT